MGLEAGARSDRRAEIDSDLWEHRNHAASEGEATLATSVSILGRWVAGIPSDLSWRVSHLFRRGQTKKEPMMANPRGRHWWQWLAALTAAATIYAGVRQVLTDEVEAGVTAGKIGGLILLAGAGVLVVIGLADYRNMPKRGAVMVIIGVLPLALIGGFGLMNIVGLITSLFGGEGWWWLPVGIASAVATAAGLGAFGAWWHATPAIAKANRPLALLPASFLFAGLLAAGLGTGMGIPPVGGAGAVAALVGVGIWRHRVKSST